MHIIPFACPSYVYVPSLKTLSIIYTFFIPSCACSAFMRHWNLWGCHSLDKNMLKLAILFESIYRWLCFMLLDWFSLLLVLGISYMIPYVGPFLANLCVWHTREYIFFFMYMYIDDIFIDRLLSYVIFCSFFISRTPFKLKCFTPRPI